MHIINEDRKLLLSAFFILLLLSLQAAVAFGEENKDSTQIFEVRKKLQMSSNDPIVRDYYVNAGQALGLKQGAYVNVFRKAPLADPFKQDTQAHVELPVGVMKVIYADRTMAIGRIQSIRSSKESPILDGDVFMVGDRVDLGTINFEKSADSKGESDSKAAGKAPSKEVKPEGAVDDENSEVSKKGDDKVEAPSDADKNAKKQSRTNASLQPILPKGFNKTEIKSDQSLNQDAKKVEVIAR